MIVLTKKYKNISGSTVIRLGQQVLDNTYYEIESSEEMDWMESAQVATDITGGDAIMNDGFSDITDPTKALEFLRAVAATCIRINTITTDAPKEGESLLWDVASDEYKFKVTDFERILVDDDGDPLVDEDFNFLIGE